MFRILLLFLLLVDAKAFCADEVDYAPTKIIDEEREIDLDNPWSSDDLEKNDKDVLEKKFYQLGVYQVRHGMFYDAIENLNKAYWVEGRRSEKALLYIAYAHFKIERYKEVDRIIKTVKQDLLPKKEINFLNRLVKANKKAYFHWKLYKERLAKLEALKKKKEEEERIANMTFFKLTPYFGSGSYSADAVKNSTTFQGLFMSAYRRSGSINLGLESLSTKYDDDFFESNYKQTQFAGSLSIVVLDGFAVKGGLTKIQQSGNADNNISVFRFGFNRFIERDYDWGLDLYFSNYPTFNDNKLGVTQVSPYYETYFSQRFSFRWTVHYIGYSINQISTTSTVDTATANDLLSTTFEGSYRKKKWTYYGMFWLGQQNLHVRNGGFFVFNSSEVHTGGFQVGVQYKKHPHGLDLSYGVESYEDPVRRTSQANGILSLKYTWFHNK